jgi:hypothetical protein
MSISEKRKDIQKIIAVDQKPGLVDRDEGSHPRGRGFKSCSILDGCQQY